MVTVTMDEWIKLEQMRLQQEQLRYVLEVLGRPIAPVTLMRYPVWRRLKHQVVVDS